MICVALAYDNFPSFEECGRKIVFYQWLGGLKINCKFKFFNKLPVFREKRITMCVCVCVTVFFNTFQKAHILLKKMRLKYISFRIHSCFK